ncbi:MAG: antibiotic biosynthesis monooxygenase [Neomegalonema sp.]|nr:antibiotic biosynthesis monooxygenase [Neomegalonema sp.]
MWMFGGPMGPKGPEREGKSAGRDREGPHSDVIVMISTFIVPAAMEDAFLGWWRMARMVITAQPGFVSARLHRSLDAREGYRYVNIAEWRGDSAYRDAIAKLWSSGPPPIPGVEWRPHLYEIVETT